MSEQPDKMTEGGESGINAWKRYALEDVIEKFIDYRGKTPKKTDAGIPLVTAKIVKAGKILRLTPILRPLA